MWTVLAIVAGVSLLFFWRSRGAAWGGLTFGVIGGLMVAVVSAFMGNGFHWATIGKGAIVGTLLGVGAELLGKVGDRMKRPPTP